MTAPPQLPSERFVKALDDPRERWQVSEAQGGTEPAWSTDGTELFYRRSGFLLAAPVEIRPSFRRLGEAIELFSTSGLLASGNHTGYDLRPDGTFLFIAARQGTDTRIVIDWVEVVEERLGGR
jgi:hypothetical protein